MLATMKGPYHCDCSFPCLSWWRMRTKSPGLMSFRTTFLSLHAFVSTWYLSRLSAAWSLDVSIISISTYRWLGVVVAISVRNDPNLNSSGVMASSSYNNKKGVNLVALGREILWPQADVMSSWAHFPFSALKSHFKMAVKIKPLALSTAPLLWGWLIEAKVSLILRSPQKFLNSVQSNCFPLSTVIYVGTPKRQMILC